MTIESSPAIGADGTIYVGSDDDNLYALNPADGSLKWQYATGNGIWSSPAVGADGTVYFGSEDNTVYALNPADGSLKWSYATGGCVYSSPALGADGTIYVGSADNYLYALNPADGSLKWKYATGGPVWSSPALGADGTIYLGSDDEHLYAFNPKDGALKWRYATGLYVDSSPALGADGTIYVGSDDGCLYAIAQAPLTQVTFTTTPPSPASCGTPVTVLAAASGGTNVAFQFWVYNPAATPAWSELQGYSNLDSCNWTPTAVGDYLLSVTARDGVSGAEVNTTAWYSVIYPPLTAVSVTPSPASPQSSNTPITLTAAATGGTNVQYQFWLYNPAANPAWCELQAYSTLDACTWTPTTAGAYLLSVTAQDGVTGTEVNKTLWYAITNSPLTAVSVTPSLASPQPAGTAITLTAAATGGTNVQYLFWLYNPAASPAWSQAQAFSAANSYQWTPSTAGVYLFSVTARDGISGVMVNAMLWYTIANSPLTAVSVTTSPASPQPPNTAITLTAAATGGSSVQYQFWVYTPSGTPAWSQLQAYSTKDTCSWIPTTAADYLLSVTAQDGATGMEVNTLQWYAITNAPLTAVSVTPSLASPQPPNTALTLTAAATGGTNVQYQFWVYAPNATPAWSQLQAYSPRTPVAGHRHPPAVICSPSPRKMVLPEQK